MSDWVIRLQEPDETERGALIILGQGHRDLRCDLNGGCGEQAIVAVLATAFGGAPQLACHKHLDVIHRSINEAHGLAPVRLRVSDAATLLQRNHQVRQRGRSGPLDKTATHAISSDLRPTV